MKVFNNTLMEKALSASWLRNEAISDNLANVDTPGYKRKDVKFEAYFKAAMNKTAISGKVTNSKHIPINPSQVDDIKIAETTDASENMMRLDGNNVDIDQEMAELAKNQILFNAYATLVSKDFSILRSAIKEGR